MTLDDEIFASRAIDWARARLGSPDYATRCLAFVEDAVERANGIEVFGGDDAAESANLYDAASRTGVPPRGAFAFYRTTGAIEGQRKDWGHVGLSLGDGTVIHAWDRVRIDDHREVEALTPAPGWDRPVWVGWAPLSRVLAGSRERTWTGDAAEAAVRMQRAHLSGRD